jgi:hypothetical protein
MTKRLPLILSTTALVVSLLGTTPLGHAARSAVSTVVPLAKTANYAKNAAKLNGHGSSLAPRAGQIPVVGKNGKLPATLGAVGPAGPAGTAGYQRVQQQGDTPNNLNNERTYAVQCPGGKKVLGGGFTFGRGQDTNDVSVIESTALSDSAWEVKVRNRTGNKAGGTITVTAVCASTS